MAGLEVVNAIAITAAVLAAATAVFVSIYSIRAQALQSRKSWTADQRLLAYREFLESVRGLEHATVHSAWTRRTASDRLSEIEELAGVDGAEIPNHSRLQQALTSHITQLELRNELSHRFSDALLGLELVASERVSVMAYATAGMVGRLDPDQDEVDEDAAKHLARIFRTLVMFMRADLAPVPLTNVELKKKLAERGFDDSAKLAGDKAEGDAE